MSSNEVPDKSDDHLPCSANKLVENKTTRELHRVSLRRVAGECGYVVVGGKRKGHLLQIEMIGGVFDDITLGLDLEG